MLQLNVTDQLAHDLDHLLIAEAHAAPAASGIECMQWFAHSFILQQKTCVIAMEINSLYCIVFKNLSDSDLFMFDELFRIRLRREVITLCRPVSHTDVDKIIALTEQVTDQLVINNETNALLEQRVRDVIGEFESIVDGLNPHCSENDWKEFTMGVELNTAFRSPHGQRNYTCPIEKFERFWLGFGDYIDLKHQEKIEEHVAKGDNILPFKIPKSTIAHHRF